MWKIVVAHYPNGADSFLEFNWDWYGMGVDVVLTGHVHAYLRYIDKYGVRYFINGNGGAQMNGVACGNPTWPNKLKTNDEFGRNLGISIKKCVDISAVGDDVYGYQRMVADERYIDLKFFGAESTGHGWEADADRIYSSPTKGVRDNRRKQDLLTIAMALDKHYQRYGSFTQPEKVYSDCSTGQFGKEGCQRGSGWAPTSDLQILVKDGDIAALPVDPINSSFFHYRYEPLNSDATHPRSGWGYELCASKLEMTGLKYCIRKERQVVDYVDCSISGVVVPHSKSRVFYQAATVPAGKTCISQTRTCTDGVLSGNASYTHASCVVLSAKDCAFDGKVVPAGSSVTAYQQATVPTGDICVSETRTCTDGVLSGDYTHASCAVISFGVDGGSNPTDGGTRVTGGCSLSASDKSDLSLEWIVFLAALGLGAWRRRRAIRQRN